MKFFYIALIALTLIIVIIAVNSLYINKVSKSLLEQIDRLDKTPLENSQALVDGIYDYWQAERDWVSISVSYMELNRIDDHVVTLKTAYNEKNDYDFKKAINLLRDAAKELSRLEKIDLSNIF